MKSNIHSVNAESSNPAARGARSGFGRSGAILACMLAGVLGGCASLSVNSTQYIGAPQFPPTDPATVEILRTQPTRAHVQLGEIAVDASINPAPPIAKVEEKVRQAAAKMGANAAVIVYDHVQPIAVVVSGGYWNRTASTITGQKLVGIAIRYQ